MFRKKGSSGQLRRTQSSFIRSKKGDESPGVSAHRLAALKARSDAMDAELAHFREVVQSEEGGDLTDVQMALFKSLFLDFDSDISGDIDQLELQRLFEKLGEPKTHLELKRLMRKHDQSDKGAISFPDFLVMMREIGAGSSVQGSSVQRKAESNAERPAESAPLKHRSRRNGGTPKTGRSGDRLSQKFDDTPSGDKHKHSDSVSPDQNQSPSTKSQRRRVHTVSSPSAAVSEPVAVLQGSAVQSSKKGDKKKSQHKHGIACLGGALHSDSAEKSNSVADHGHGHSHGHGHDHDAAHPHGDGSHSHHAHEHTEQELARMSNAELLEDHALHERQRLEREENERKAALRDAKRADLDRFERELKKRHALVKQREATVERRELRAKKLHVRCTNLNEDLTAFEKILKQRHRQLAQALERVQDVQKREELEALAPVNPEADPVLRAYDEKKVIRAQHVAKRWIMQRRARRLMDLVARVRASNDAETARVRKRNAVIKEIYASEKSYVDSLVQCVKVYLKPFELQLESGAAFDPETMLSRPEMRMIFGDLEILVLLNGEFLKELDRTINGTDPNTAKSQISEAFLRIAPLLQLYRRYVANYEDAVNKLGSIREDRPKVAAYLDKIQFEVDEGKRDLASFLIMPVQRPMRYDMLLQEVIKQTPNDHVDLDNLKISLQAVQEVVAGINEHKRDREEEAQFAKQLASGEAKKRGLGSRKKAGTLLDLTAGSVGKLSITLLRARGLLAMDASGTSDPYAKLSLGDQDRKSKTIKKTLTPEWKEDFAFIVPDLDTPIELEVWDWDRVGGDDFIGSGVILLRSLAEETTTDWFPILTKKGKPAGEVEMTITFKG